MNIRHLRWSASPAAIAVCGAAVLVGVFLRLDQIAAQVLIDDEWHAVHQVIRRTPASMFLDFGYADYSIPLGILYWFEAQGFGLSEAAMRWPMVVCGLATLVAMPLYVARRFPPAVTALFAVLLAISPLLVIYSRMARPYAITLLLGWLAHAAYQRYHVEPRRRAAAGAVYATSATMAIWMHPILAPFALAPLLWGLVQLRHAAPGARRAGFVRWLALALPTAVTLAALLLPPIVANPQSLTAKGSIDLPTLSTLVGAAHSWLGTPSIVAVGMGVALALCGAGDVWRRLPAARSGTLGVVLTIAAVLLTRPMWSFNSITFARYLLPMVPLLLLGVAAGTVRIANRVANTLARPPTWRWGAAFAALAATPVVVLAAQSPLLPMLRYPNTQTLHFWYYFDFRSDHHPYVPLLDVIPLSPFWSGLSALPPGSVRVAAAPFHFESYNWDAPRWERVGRQAVLPGFLTGLCVDKRWGEVPQSPAFRLSNAVHLADDAALARKGIDYVVWQKPYLQPNAANPSPAGSDTAHCEAILRMKFGPPAYEDAFLVAFRLPRATPAAPSAER